MHLVFLVHLLSLAFLVYVARRTNETASPTHHVDRRHAPSNTIDQTGLNTYNLSVPHS